MTGKKNSRNIEIIKGTLTISRTGLQLKGVGENGEYINLYIGIIPELETVGVCSRTLDDYHVLFMDFDDIKLDVLKRHLARLSANYGISHFLILTTGNNRYHAISFEKFTKAEIEKILQDSYVDLSFRHPNISSIDTGWVLRVEKKTLGDKVVKEKPEFVDFLIFCKPKRKLSTAHYNFYKKYFNNEKFEFFEKYIANEFSNDKGVIGGNTPYFDGLFTVEIVKYKTTHRSLNTFEYNLINKRLRIKVRL